MKPKMSFFPPFFPPLSFNSLLIKDPRHNVWVGYKAWQDMRILSDTIRTNDTLATWAYSVMSTWHSDIDRVDRSSFFCFFFFLLRHSPLGSRVSKT